MDKEEILRQLYFGHARFVTLISTLPDSDFLNAINDKWSPEQQLDHIIKSISAVNLGVGLPGFLLRIIFGKPNRPSRDYDELVAKYQLKLAGGGKAPSSFIPGTYGIHYRERLQKKLRHKIYTLMYRIGSFSEKNLDSILLPHPLLGKLTIREMLYFTIYHVEHHQKQVVKNLENTPLP